MSKEQFPFYLAIAIVLGFFGLLYVAIFHQVPTTSAQLVDVLIGSLAAAVTSIVNYYFGSSSGSAAKTAIIAEQVKQDGK